MAEKAIFNNVRHKAAITLCEMHVNPLENKVPEDAPWPEAFTMGQAGSQGGLEGGAQKFGISRLVCGGLIFVGLTVGIFWYQFARIPGGSPAVIWSQLQWDYVWWLLLFLPIDSVAAGLRIWVIGRVLQPGVSFWTCLKAEWANLGLAMLTPSQTGGGFGQIYILNRGGMRLGTALTVSLISFMGSMVVLLFIGIHFILISRVEHLAVFFQGALCIFFLVFGALIVAVCWPGSVRWVVSGIARTIGRIGGQNHGSDDSCRPQTTRIRHLGQYLHTLSEKLIDLGTMHQVNVRRFFRLKSAGFLWVCLLSLAFMLSRAILAFLCLRFLGIQAADLANVLETQLGLIFLIYFAPTPGSSGLAEGASMLMMDPIMPAVWVPYYNLLWRCTTLYLPAVAGLVFLSWTLMQDARRHFN